MNVDLASILSELFAASHVHHGQVFDDGRRWCTGCMHPRPHKAVEKTTSWKDRCCPVCSALWPEYVEEFIQQAMLDEIEDIDLSYIH